MSYDSPSTRLSLESVAVGCVDGDHDDHSGCDDHPDGDHDDHGDCDDYPDVINGDQVDDCNCCGSGGGAGVEAPLDRQQIPNDQKCVFTFYKNTIRVARRVLSLLGYSHGHCTDGELCFSR